MLYLLGITTLLLGIAYSFPCCVVHDTVQSCAAEASGACVWLGDTHQLVISGASMGAKCVSDPWYQCEMGVYCPPAPIAPPSQVASSDCYLTPCAQNTFEYNVAFVIDESGSVGKKNYQNSLKFVEDMVTNNIQDNANISMIAFASGTDRIYHFSDSQNDQRAGALTAIAAEKNDYKGGMTCMRYALELLETEIQSDPNIIPDDHTILFLMTDGYPNCGGDVCDMKPRLDALGVDIWMIGVGADFDRNKVRCLVDLDPKIVNIATFDTEDFYKIESQLRTTVCPVVFEEGIFARINNIMYEYGMTTGSIAVWVIFAIFIIGTLTYWNRDRLCDKSCNKSSKYELIPDESCYGATSTV